MNNRLLHSLSALGVRYLFLPVILLIIGVLPAMAEPETIVIGEVFDAQTHLPIENASVYFKNTRIGTATNPDGLFLLRTDQPHGEVLVISAVGYKSQRIKVKAGQYATLQVDLTEENTQLQDVFVMPGSNPALPLMEQVRARRTQNNALMRADYEANETERFSLMVSDIDSKNLHRRIWQQLKAGLVVTEDSTLFLPLYLAENTYRLHGNKKDLLHTERKRNTLFSESGADAEALQNMLGQNVDFYRNTITLFGRNFISPLASGGNAYYNYYLADSLATDGGKQYIVHFKSKNTKNLAFTGQMHIDSATYALQRISATLPPKAAVNYLAGLQITQEFGGQPPFQKTGEQLTALFDLAVQADSTHFFPTLYASRSSQLAAEETPDIQLSPLDEQVESALDSLGETKLMKFAQWAAQTIFTGYAPAGYIDVGKVVELAGYNSLEGLRLGVPLRTSEKLMKNICLEGYAAYGFGDKNWKYMGRVQFRLPAEQRHVISLSYTDDYTYTEYGNFDMFLRENTSGRGYKDLSSSLLNVFERQSHLARRRDAALGFQDEWTDNFETRIELHGGLQNYGTPVGTFKTAPTFRYNSLMLVGRWSWNERVIDSFFTRRYLYNNLPVLHAGIEGGTFQITGTQTNGSYAKINLMLRQKVQVGMLGTVSYLAQAGYIFGNVPYPLLQTMHGNETWGFDRYKFSLMNDGEFVADKYVFLHAEWNLRGFLFNRIPGVKRLNLQEIICFKGAYGGLRSSHADILPFPDGTATFSEPYLEAGVGIGNILRVLNVHFAWRLTERNRPGANLWGVKFQLDLGM